MIEQVKLTHNEKATLGKIKQWLSFLKFRYDEVPDFFKQVRSIKSIPELIDVTQAQLSR